MTRVKFKRLDDAERRDYRSWRMARKAEHNTGVLPLLPQSWPYSNVVGLCCLKPHLCSRNGGRPPHDRGYLGRGVSRGDKNCICR